MNNEQIIRTAYERAEKVDVKGWTQCFTPDGTFTDMSIGVTYRGPTAPPPRQDGRGLCEGVPGHASRPVSVLQHRDVVSWSSLCRARTGALPTPMGILPATGKRMDAPCCDVSGS